MSPTLGLPKSAPGIRVSACLHISSYPASCFCFTSLNSHIFIGFMQSSQEFELPTTAWRPLSLPHLPQPILYERTPPRGRGGRRAHRMGSGVRVERRAAHESNGGQHACRTAGGRRMAGRRASNGGRRARRTAGGERVERRAPSVCAPNGRRRAASGVRIEASGARATASEAGVVGEAGRRHARQTASRECVRIERRAAYASNGVRQAGRCERRMSNCGRDRCSGRGSRAGRRRACRKAAACSSNGGQRARQTASTEPVRMERWAASACAWNGGRRMHRTANGGQQARARRGERRTRRTASSERGVRIEWWAACVSSGKHRARTHRTASRACIGRQAGRTSDGERGAHRTACTCASAGERRARYTQAAGGVCIAVLFGMFQPAFILICSKLIAGGHYFNVFWTYFT